MLSLFYNIFVCHTRAVSLLIHERETHVRSLFLFRRERHARGLFSCSRESYTRAVQERATRARSLSFFKRARALFFLSFVQYLSANRTFRSIVPCAILFIGMFSRVRSALFLLRAVESKMYTYALYAKISVLHEDGNN